MNVLDLFSGIGGFSLGLERAGMRTVAFCEIEPYCRAVLAKHWPGVPIYPDVRELNAERLRSDGVTVDVICGGFPCQDVSVAGNRAGLAGARSGLWREYSRLIREIGPQFVIVENTPGLLSLGMGDVLGDLAAIGYDAEWHCIPASAVGAPHLRDRVWIISYPNQNRALVQRRDRNRHDAEWHEAPQIQEREDLEPGSECASTVDGAYSDDQWELQPQRRIGDIWRWLGNSDWWTIEPDVGRMAYGVPAGAQRIAALGNAVVPQIPEIIGRAIMTVSQSPLSSQDQPSLTTQGD